MSKFIPPDWLSERAVDVFEDTVKALGAQAVPSDLSVIAEYAQAQADCEEWARNVRFEGEVIRSNIGNQYVNPRYTNLQARRKDLERLRDDLGMTPKSRGVVLKGAGKSGLAAAMNG